MFKGSPMGRPLNFYLRKSITFCLQLRLPDPILEFTVVANKLFKISPNRLAFNLD